ncbi:FeoA family protein [Actinomycetaceae bacterium MB13-C1-2]|nr:FeoA family protein [Actinomycetaceae bacterium MB13-C1-2]
MNLGECPLRVKSQIVSIDVGSQYCLRLKELGVRPGANFFCVNRAAFGGVVINISGTRIAVDRRSARNIEVLQLQGDPS